MDDSIRPVCRSRNRGALSKARIQRPRLVQHSSTILRTCSRAWPVRFWIRPTSSSSFPSTNCRSSSVSCANFCFNLPLAMFQLPFISRVFINLFCCFYLFRAQFHAVKNCPARDVPREKYFSPAHKFEVSRLNDSGRQPSSPLEAKPFCKLHRRSFGGLQLALFSLVDFWRGPQVYPCFLLKRA